MKKPEVKLENYKEVYDYYEHRRTHPLIAKFGFRVLSSAIHPQISTQHEDTAEQITELLRNGTQLVVASNHKALMDPPVLASTVVHFQPFRPLIGNAFIPSKNPLFKPSLRWAIDILGATPQFRTKNLTRDGQPLPQDIRDLRNGALVRSFEMARGKMENQGMHMGIYPQKERVEGDRIEGIGFALGEILCNLDPSVDVALVPMAQHYGNSRFKLRPRVVIGSPIPGPFEKPSDFEPDLIVNMQECLDLAAAA